MNPTQKSARLTGAEEMKMLTHFDLDTEELEQRLELALLAFASCGLNCQCNCTSLCCANCGADCSHICTLHAC